MVESAKLSIPVDHSLSIQPIKKLRLYILNSSTHKETDRPFPEPGMSAVNAEGKIHLIDVSNTPLQPIRPWRTTQNNRVYKGK